MSESRVLVIIQARMGSQRLPGKVLCDIEGRPMLEWMIRRIRCAQRVNEIVVATSNERQDRPIIDLCRRLGISSYAGSHTDVLDRFARAAERFPADWIVRITADCPLIDPELVDQVIALAQEPAGFDMTCNVFPRRTFPRGLDVEIVRANLLAQLDRTVAEPNLREHVTAAIYRAPERYRIGSVEAAGDFSEIRWTVDESADLQLVRAIYAELKGRSFRWADGLAAWQRHPEWWSMNAMVEQKVA